MSCFDAYSYPALNSALAWWQGVRGLWTRAAHGHAIAPEDAARIAADSGVSPSLFVRIIGEPNGATALLYRRLRALGLDPTEIYRLSPMLLADLERNCALCPDKARCEADMADDPNPPGWESYCPNSGTLRTLT
jgi:hypothetical protein